MGALGGCWTHIMMQYIHTHTHTLTHMNLVGQKGLGTKGLSIEPKCLFALHGRNEGKGSLLSPVVFLSLSLNTFFYFGGWYSMLGVRFYVLCAPSTAPRHLRPIHLRPVNCAPSTAPRHLRPSQMLPTSTASESEPTAPHIKIWMCTVIVYKVSSKISMFHYKPYMYVYTNAL
jgi:hypothetical protein